MNNMEETLNNILPMEDDRLLSVIQLAKTCNYEAGHTQQVTFLALTLFDELSSIHHLGARERFWLHCAAILHDIGWFEGRKNHHKAALRIILSTPLLPFDSKERLIIGSVARYHRKALPDLSHDHYASLAPEEREIVRILAAILRMADGLDCLHQDRILSLACKVTKRKVKMICIVQDLIPNEELVSLNKADLFELVFQRKLDLEFKKDRHA